MVEYPMVYPIEKDVSALHGWYYVTKADYQKLVLPKVPLLIAALTEDQAKPCVGFLKEDGWREVGWYPSCHDTLDKGYKVILFCKEQDVPPVEGPVGAKGYDGKFYASRTFNEYVPLSCSCVSYPKMVKMTRKSDQHATLGVHRRTTPMRTKRVTMNNWRKFATTPLATYWFWGLAPDETDRHEYEKRG